MGLRWPLRDGAPAVSSIWRSLLLGQGRAPVGVVLAAGEQMPEQDGEFAGDGDGRDLVPAASADALVEGAHRSRRADREQRGFGQGVADGAWSAFADPAVVGWVAAGLADRGVQTEVADELAG